MHKNNNLLNKANVKMCKKENSANGGTSSIVVLSYTCRGKTYYSCINYYFGDCCDACNRK